MKELQDLEVPSVDRSIGEGWTLKDAEERVHMEEVFPASM